MCDDILEGVIFLLSKKVEINFEKKFENQKLKFPSAFMCKNAIKQVRGSNFWWIFEVEGKITKSVIFGEGGGIFDQKVLATLPVTTTNTVLLN